MLNYPIEGKSILEIGCGIALPSLLLNKRHANITATDYHPETKDFIRNNLMLNEDTGFPFIQADWSEANNELKKYDLIIASDLLYQRNFPKILSNFINIHLNQDGEVLLVDPSRGNTNNFIKEMKILKYNCIQDTQTFTSHLNQKQPFKILKFCKKN